MTTPVLDDVLGQIIEDLRFYSELGIRVKKIKLGSAAYMEVLRHSLVCPSPLSEVMDIEGTLFGIPLVLMRAEKQWSRGYEFYDQRNHLGEFQQ